MVIVLGVVTPRHVVIMMGAREKKKQAKRKRLAEKLCVEDVKALGGSEVIDWGGRRGHVKRTDHRRQALVFQKVWGLGCGFLVRSFHMI